MNSWITSANLRGCGPGAVGSAAWPVTMTPEAEILANRGETGPGRLGGALKKPGVSTALETAFRRCSPRLNPRPTRLAGVVLYTAIVALWLAAMAKAFVGQGVFAWSVGIVYIAYDGCLHAFVAWQALALWRRPGKNPPRPFTRPTIGVIIAAYNEA